MVRWNCSARWRYGSSQDSTGAKTIGAGKGSKPRALYRVKNNLQTIFPLTTTKNMTKPGFWYGFFHLLFFFYNDYLYEHGYWSCWASYYFFYYFFPALEDIFAEPDSIISWRHRDMVGLAEDGHFSGGGFIRISYPRAREWRQDGKEGAVDLLMSCSLGVSCVAIGTCISRWSSYWAAWMDDSIQDMEERRVAHLVHKKYLDRFWGV